MTEASASAPPRVGVLTAPFAAATIRDIVVGSSGVCVPVFLVRSGMSQQVPGLLRAAQAAGEVHVIADDEVAGSVGLLSLSGLTTFHDGELEHVDSALAATGLPGAPPPGSSPWDKLVQRRAFGAARVSQTAVVPVDGEQDFRCALDEVGVPCVLKPRRGSASVGISFLLTQDDVEAELARRASWANLVLETWIPLGAHPVVSWLADYVSVETISDGSGHHHVAIVDKFKLSIQRASPTSTGQQVMETGDVYPSQLPYDARRRVLEAVRGALDALDVRSRVTHTEVKVTADRPEVVEVNGRLGGEVTRLLGHHGMVRAAFQVALGQQPDLPRDGRSGIAATLYPTFPVRDGVVRSDVSRRDLRRLPGVTGVDDVALHGASRQDHQSRVASVMLQADDVGGLASGLRGFCEGVVDLFALDGLAEDTWISELVRDLDAGDVAAV